MNKRKIIILFAVLISVLQVFLKIIIGLADKATGPT